MEPWITPVLVGAVATLAMDLWTLARSRFFRIPSLDYRLVGRWLLWLPRGRMSHHPITSSAPMSGERWVGWTAHYLIGIAFATILLAVAGSGWSSHPTIGPALAVGIGSVAAPFLIMQPALGFGFAASRTPKPAAARLRSLATHAVFGLGLWAGGWVAVGLSAFFGRIS